MVGKLQKWVPVGSGVTVVYQIGDATTYAPVSVTFGTVGSTGQLIAFTTPGEHPSIGSAPLNPALDVNRWWTLTNAGVVFNTLAATFTFAPADVDLGAQTSRFVVAKRDGSWAAPTSGANTTTTITAFGMSSLSEFAVGEPAADLLVSKNGPASATAGAPAGFDYTLTVHNAGPAANSSGFTISDALPAGLTFQPSGSDGRCAAVGQVVTCTNVVGLNSGANDVFVLHVTLASTVAAGTILGNTAVVTSRGTNDPDGTNNASSTTTAVVVNVTPTSTPSASGSVPDTGSAALVGQVSPVVLLVAFAACVVLLTALAGGRARRRGSRR